MPTSAQYEERANVLANRATILLKRDRPLPDRVVLANALANTAAVYAQLAMLNRRDDEG